MKKTLLGLGAFALLLGTVGVSASTAFAYKGDPAVKGPNYSVERHAAMEKAFDQKDYTSWKNLMDGKGRASQIVTKENFAKFVEAHELAEQGKISEAQKIRQELGLGLKNGSGQKNGGKGMGRNGRH
jgi:hypothetical protein